MTTTITIPSSIEEAVHSLEGIESLVRKKGWERAATVAAFVRLDEGHGGKHADIRVFHSANSFAALGVTGLSHQETVRFYVNRWLDEIGDYPEPGDDVVLPEKEWPPGSTRGTDGYDSDEGAVRTVTKIATKNPQAIGKALAADPDLARKVGRASDETSHEGLWTAATESTNARTERHFTERGQKLPEPRAPRRSPAYFQIGVLTADSAATLRKAVRLYEAQEQDPDDEFRVDDEQREILAHDLDRIIAIAELWRSALRGAPADLSSLLAEEGGR